MFFRAWAVFQETSFGTGGKQSSKEERKRKETDRVFLTVVFLKHWPFRWAKVLEQIILGVNVSKQQALFGFISLAWYNWAKLVTYLLDTTSVAPWSLKGNVPCHLYIVQVTIKAPLTWLLSAFSKLFHFFFRSPFLCWQCVWVIVLLHWWRPSQLDWMQSADLWIHRVVPRPSPTDHSLIFMLVYPILSTNTVFAGGTQDSNLSNAQSSQQDTPGQQESSHRLWWLMFILSS